MRILALDPSSKATGWAVFDTEAAQPLLTYGHISPLKDWDSPHKLGYIYDHILDLVGHFDPDCIAVEDQVFQFVNATIVVSRVRGVIDLVTYCNNLPQHVWHIGTIKKHFTGNGKAKKEDMVRVAKEKYDLDQITDDEADAIAIAELTATKLAGGI